MRSSTVRSRTDSENNIDPVRRTGGTRRFLFILIPAALLFLCVEPWGLQASYRQDPLPLVYETSLEIVAVGDIMTHLSQIESVYDPKGDRYDFIPQFLAIKELVSSADIAIGNLETSFTPKRRPSGYPKFNAPDDLARDLRATGFDLLVTANNHALDYGEAGIIGTLDALQKNSIKAIGTGRNWEEAMRPVIVERNGIRVAFLAYTCGTNGIKRPESKEYLLNLYSKREAEKGVAAAVREGADLILAYIHFGAEYERFPDPDQYRIAEELRQAGVHVILGSHPHVIQPENNRIQEKQYTLFSLGNFISGQRGNFRDIGLMLNLRLVKTHPAGLTRIDRVAYTPTYVSRSKKGGGVAYRVVPLQQVDLRLSKRYRGQLTYNKTSLNSDLLGHVRGGVYLEK